MYNFGNISSMFKGVNFTKILQGSSKTINIVKQAVPLYRDIKPYIDKKKSKNVQEVKVIPKTIEKEKKTENRNVINDTLTFFQ